MFQNALIRDFRDIRNKLGLLTPRTDHTYGLATGSSSRPLSWALSRPGKIDEVTPVYGAVDLKDVRGNASEANSCRPLVAAGGGLYFLPVCD